MSQVITLEMHVQSGDGLGVATCVNLLMPHGDILPLRMCVLRAVGNQKMFVLLSL